MLSRISLLLMTLALCGCSDVRTYSVTVKNDTNDPLTLNLTKDQPQNEPVWASPEDLDAGRAFVTPDLGVVTVPPGRHGSARNVSGHFPDHMQAILRIYRGRDLKEAELLAMKPGADRQDVPLNPGNNEFVVSDKDGKMTVKRVK